MKKLPIYPQPDTLDLGEAQQRDSGCRKCKLGGTGPYTCMPTFAKDPKEIKVLFVFGEGHDGAAKPAPLDAKIQQRYMGTGARSHVIPKLMKQFGFDQMDAAYAHAVRCSTEQVKFNKDFSIEDAISACKPYMADTLGKLPNLERIICIGPIAQKAILGRSINQNAINPYSWYQHNGRDIAVFALKWPVTNEENKFKHRSYAMSLAFALQCDLGSLNPAPWGKQMFVVQTAEEARQACDDLRQGKFVAFDTEWSGIMFDNTDFTVLSLSATRPGLEGAYLWYGKYLYQEEIRRPIDELLSDPTVPISGQNVKADIHCMKHGFGVEVTNIYGDTQLQRKLYETDRDGADLDTLAESVGMGGHKKDMKEAVGVAVKIIKVARKKEEGRKLNAPERAILEDNEKFYKSKYCKVAIDNPHVEPEAFAYGMTSKLLLNRYNCKDTIATALVQEMLDEAIDYVTVKDFDGNPNWKPLRYVWDTLVSKAVPAVAQMEQWGICVDKGNIDLVRFKADEKIAELEKRLQAVADINWGSSMQRQEVFYGKLKLPPPPKQVESNPKSTSKKVVNWWLKNNHNPHGIVQAYADYNDIKTLRSNYTDKLESYIRGDGRVHPSFKLDGTVSGRMSCVEPNLQQIPRAQSDIAKMVKNCFQAAPGYTLIQCFTPGQRVLTDSMDWVKIEDLKEGDELVSFDEHTKPGTKGQRLRKAVVEKVTSHIAKNVVRINTTQGSLLTTADHPVLATKGLGTTRDWVKAGDLTTKHCIAYIAEPWHKNTTADGSWMEGFLDGEGWVSGNTCGVGQKPGYCLEKAKSILETDNFDFSETVTDKTNVHQLRPRGCWAPMRFIGVYGSKRLRDNFVYEGKQSWGRCTPRAAVLSIDKLPPQEVISVKTSTSTLVVEGFMVHNCDYSQLELRIASMMSEDPGMIDIYVRGEDYHTGTAKAISKVMWGINPEEVEKKHRSAAKTLNFAMLYGMGDETLAFTLGVATKVARKLRASVMGAFSKLDAWFKAQLKVAETTGYCWTWWDGHLARRRNLFDIDSKNGGERSKAKNGSGNTPIQGTASDFNIASLPKCLAWIKANPQYKARMVLTVHDSLIFEAPDEHVQVVASNMQKIMQSWNAKGVPVVVDCEVGKAWGSLKNYNTQTGEVEG